MGGLFSKPKAPKKDAAAEAREKALKDENAALDKRLKIAETPTKMPDEDNEARRRSKLAALAQEQEAGFSSSETVLTGSRLGDASSAYKRTGRAPGSGSSIMSGEA